MTERRLNTLIPASPQTSVTISETGWQPDDTMSYEQWAQVGQQLLRMGRAWQWWLGDWILYGEHHYGDTYTEAIETTGLEYKTIANVISVARRVESSRRRENLSWSHHAEVAALEPPEQVRWLDQAEQDNLTVEKLRKQLRTSRTTPVDNAEPEPQATFAAEITVVFHAHDLADAEQRTDQLAVRLEKTGASVRYKRTQPRHR